MDVRPSYLAVFRTFVRNSLVRDMSFRSNFIIECVTSVAWVTMNIGFYLLVFSHTSSIGDGTGWGKYEFFVFLATGMFINTIVQAFFTPNAEEFSELIRTGGLDFALLKPIDTQFLISLQKVDWASLINLLVAAVLLIFSLGQLTTRAVEPLVLHPVVFLLYPFYIVCGVAMMYSLTIVLAACSVWMGRNTTIYDFWFYITNFARYPMEIYTGAYGTPLRLAFTFVIPVLIVVNVPARLMAWPLNFDNPDAWFLPAYTVIATVTSLFVSRWVFQRALGSYRSASS